VNDKFAHTHTTGQESTSSRALEKQKILILSYQLYPNVGGIERVALLVTGLPYLML
jgi:hypothetical protein